MTLPIPFGDGLQKRMVAELAAVLAAAVRIEVRYGPAYETYPSTEDLEPLAVVDDPAVIRELADELSVGLLSHRVVVQALPGVSLVCFDAEGEFVCGIGLLSSRWVRYAGWPYDMILPGPVPSMLIEPAGQPGLFTAAARVIDQIEPSVPAASEPAVPDVEHAQLGSGAPTLCGIPATDVVTYRHTFRFGRGDCPDCARLVWDQDAAFPRRTAPTVSAAAQRLSVLWEQRWPDTPPVAHELPTDDHWVRFHSLPQSKRYADNESEYRELLHRHRTVLAQLAADSSPASPELLVVTSTWSAGETPMPRSAPVAAVLPDAEHWRSFVTDDSDPVSPTWTHLYIDTVELGDPRLDQLLRMVADFHTADVMITDCDLRWLYHPYDGGADVHAATTAQRDRLRARHADWLSTHPSGR